MLLLSAEPPWLSSSTSQHPQDILRAHQYCGYRALMNTQGMASTPPVLVPPTPPCIPAIYYAIYFLYGPLLYIGLYVFETCFMQPMLSSSLLHSWGWPWTFDSPSPNYIAEVDLELLIPLPLTPKCWDYRLVQSCLPSLLGKSVKRTSPTLNPFTQVHEISSLV